MRWCQIINSPRCINVFRDWVELIPPQATRCAKKEDSEMIMEEASC